MSLRIGHTALTALLAIGCAPLQKTVAVDPSIVVVEGEAATRIDRYLTRATAFGFSGAVLVADSSGMILQRGYGIADEASSKAITPATVFDMGSIVKQFTAAGILLLESEGRLTTADKVSRFFPEAPEDKRDITLHQLMTHTSGVTDNLSGDYTYISRDSAIKVVMNAPLLSKPGSAFNYSNAGFSLLAAIIEQVSGQAYEAFIKTRIFRPAGMPNSGYHVPALDSSMVAHTYTPPIDRGDPASRLARSNGPSWNLIGNGGMLTTIVDVYRYELSLRRGRPISFALQAKQFAEQFRRSPVEAHGYDWWIEPAEDGGLQYNRGADAPGLGVQGEYRRYPKDNSAFVMLGNTRHHGWSSRRYIMSNMRKLFTAMSSIDIPEVSVASTERLAGLPGTYAIDSVSWFRLDTLRGRVVVNAFGQRAVDVLVSTHDSTSLLNRSRANDRTANLFKALALGDTAGTLAPFGGAARARRLRAAWSEAERDMGKFRCVQILGTDRLDRGTLLTSVRLTFADSVRTVRFAWNGTVAVANSEDAGLLNYFGFAPDSPVDGAVWSPYWYVSDGMLLTYDIASSQALHARVSRNAAGLVTKIVFDTPTGPVIATHETVAYSPSNRPRPLCFDQ